MMEKADIEDIICAILIGSITSSKGAEKIMEMCKPKLKESSNFFCEGQYDEGGDGCEKQCERCKNL